MSQTFDADLFTTLHDFLGPTDGAEQDDRRRRPRLSFPTTQRIAPYIQGRLPTKMLLRPIQCEDLSTSGLAYYADEPPKSDRLVVELSGEQGIMYLTAAVAHCRRLSHGPAKYLVGCQFLGRVTL